MSETVCSRGTEETTNAFGRRSMQSPSPISFEDHSFETEVPLPHITSDELPIFSIQSISPTGRSLSPIDAEPFSLFNLSTTPNQYDGDKGDRHFLNRCDDLITLEEMNAQIGTPVHYGASTKRLDLDTIYEGVFLETPPKKSDSHQRAEICRRLAFKSLQSVENARAPPEPQRGPEPDASDVLIDLIRSKLDLLENQMN